MDLEKEIIQLLKQSDISYALTLPCAKVKRLINLCSINFNHIPLSREEEGIGIATGLYLTGKKSVLIIQSGGIGNSLNALLSLALVYKIPIPIIVSWRGIYKENIEAQVPFGEYLPDIFKAINFPFVEINKAQDFDKINEAIETCFQKEIPVGIFISPEFWEESVIEKSNQNKIFDKIFPDRKNKIEIQLTTTIEKPKFSRFQILESIKSELKGKVVVSNIGIPSKELYHIIDQPSNFYMLGSFGMVSAIGLGLAIASRKEIIVIDGDASILTNPNILGTIIQEKNNCQKLTILLMDNGTCGSTGNQITSAYFNLDLEVLARAYGFTYTEKVYNEEETIKALKELPFGPRIIHVIIRPENALVENIPLTAIQIKERFQTSFH